MPDLPFHLREVRPGDLSFMVDIFNGIYPDEPVTLAQVEHWERTYPAGNPRLRYAVVWEDGRTVAVGACLNPFWMTSPGAYWVDISVHPEFQRRGIGRALLEPLERYGWAQGAERLWGSSREDHLAAVRFLERAGYTTFGIRFESALDLDDFDETPVTAVWERVRRAGYRLTSHAVAQETEPDADRRLYELFQRTIDDVPFPGGAVPQTPAFDVWRSWILEGPAADPAGIFVARQGDRFVGLTQVELPESGPAITGMTGVEQGHRRQGLALALKLLSFRFLRERGYREVRTHNDTANPAILALNARLGYRRLPGWLSWEKLPGSRPA